MSLCRARRETSEVSVAIENSGMIRQFWDERPAAFDCWTRSKLPYLEQDRGSFVWQRTPKKFGQELCHPDEKKREYS